MRRSVQRLMDLIPVFPGACSLVVLSIAEGSLKLPCSERGIRKALRRTERRLAVLTAQEPRVLEWRAPLQKSTEMQLSRTGFPDHLMEGGEIAYLSLMAEDGDEKE